MSEEKVMARVKAEGCRFCVCVLVLIFLLRVLDQHLPASLLGQAVADVADPKARGNSSLCFKIE